MTASPKQLALLCLAAALPISDAVQAAPIMRQELLKNSVSNPSLGIDASGNVRASPLPSAFLELEQGRAGYARNCLQGSARSGLSGSITPHYSWWLEIPPAKVPTGKHKLALLMLANNTVNNAWLWSAWAKQARDANLSFSFLIHAHGINTPKEFLAKEFQDNVVTRKVPTAWCNVWDAEMELVQQALADPDITHLMVLSADAIPVKPLQAIYNDLAKNPRTRMCMDNSYKPEDVFLEMGQTAGRAGPRAESWWLMHRGDAELFRDNYFAVKANFVRGCAEEESWWYPLKLRMEHWGEEAAVTDSCPVYTNWALGRNCKKWADHASQCDCPKLFTEEHIGSTNGHPTTFLRLGKDAARELSKSPFWFARKFVDGSVLAEVSDLF